MLWLVGKLSRVDWGGGVHQVGEIAKISSPLQMLLQMQTGIRPKDIYMNTVSDGNLRQWETKEKYHTMDKKAIWGTSTPCIEWDKRANNPKDTSLI